MKSNSKRDPILPTFRAGRSFFHFLVCTILFYVAFIPFPAWAGTSLTEMARLEAADSATTAGTVSLFRGYLSLGLLPEAASLLERRVRLGLFPADSAVPLFEEVAGAQSRYPDPERLVDIAETAIRSGARTPLILYYYGTGLRGTAGRVGDASAFLAQAGTEGPYGLLALYSLGQIAAERKDAARALELFRRVEEASGGAEEGSLLAKRAARSRAELLLAGGNDSEAARIFELLLRKGNDPLDRIGFAAAGEDPLGNMEQLPAEMIAGGALGERTRFLLLLGGLARERGRYDTAVDALTRAGKELDEALAAAAPPPSETPDRSAGVESLRAQLERLRRLRQGLSSLDAQGKYLPRSVVLELLVGILFADRTVLRIAAEMRTPGDIRFLPSGEIGEIVRRIEEETLDGIEVDRLVEQMSAAFDTLQNLGHPMERYRRLVRLEKSQEEIHHLRDRIREQREATLAAITSGKDAEAPVHLRDVGLFLTELDVFRSAAAETREFTKQHFNILREKRRGENAEDSADLAVRETIAYVDARMKALLPIVRAFEEMERDAAWKRRIPGLKAMRFAVERQLADTLVRQAREMRIGPGEADREKSISAIGRAVSLLSGGRLAPEDVPEVAVRVGSVLAEGRGRWEPFPGRSADEKEREMIARILPLLPREGPSGARREEALYLDAVLRMAVKDPGAGHAAREYLEKYPASPLSAGIGVQLGHEALLAGKTAGAVARYLAAADSGNPGASAVARYMIAWVRFQSGDVGRTLRELSPVLSEPSFPCANPSTFEGDTIALAVRAWKESSTDTLGSYPPVKEGTCGGKVLLSALWEAEEKRGEAARSAAVRDIATRRFPSDDGAAALEMETVEALMRAGRDGEAVSRALTLPGKYGPDSPWAQSRPAPVKEKIAAEMAGMLKTLAERKFDEGVRTGAGAAHSSAAELIEEYFRLRGGEPSIEDGELRLKRAIALLGSGDRAGGILLLEELVGEKRGDATGERAAVLYAETLIAGYERGESSADDAENAAFLLLEERPSEKAVSLTLRASSAFLAGREYGRARFAAEEAEGSRSATPSQATQARLIQAEAAVFEEDLPAARGKADLVLSDNTAGRDSGATTRAKDLYLLSSLKEIGEKEVSGDVMGAATALEDLAAKFSRAPELPIYLLRATRLYAKGGDEEGAIRTGLRFLREFPRREEAPEVAAVVGPLLEGKEEFSRAGDLYEGVADGFPKSAASPRFLFHAARIAEAHGPPEAAARRFSSYRTRYSSPAGMWTYATLYLGLDGWRRGDPKKSIRLMEEGLRKLDAGAGEDSPEELADLAGKVRIAIGESWADQFRKTRLVVPLEKSLAIKEKLFRRALGEFEKAGKEAPLEVALHADLLSGDLFAEYGKAILDSQRPKGLKGSDREEYEETLRKRARSYIERSVDWYAGALQRLDEEEGPSDLAVPIRNRLETAQLLLEGTGTAKEGKAQ